MFFYNKTKALGASDMKPRSVSDCSKYSGDCLKCNCGREGVYSHINLDNPEESLLNCNKYHVYPTYDQLKDELFKYRSLYMETLQSAKNLMLYREGTQPYKDAATHIKEKLGDNLWS